MAKMTSAQTRLSIMLLLTTIFFMVEIIVGYITNSMALIADSFHMFSDAIALVIAFISVRMSPKKWSKNTFGWARAEILGALVNAVFLCALCVSILIESVKRFIKPDLIHDPHLILIVGGLGLFINLIGLVLFSGHMHHHHGHVHSHHHNHKHSPVTQEDEFLVCQGDSLVHDMTSPERIKYGLLGKHCNHTGSQDLLCKTGKNSQTPSLNNQNTSDENNVTKMESPHSDSDECNQSSSASRHISMDIGGSNDKVNADVNLAFRPPSTKHANVNHHHSHVDVHLDDDNQHKAKKHSTSNQMNMHGVFLHVMADALGSVIVMISALVVLYTEWTIRLYIDPILSVIMVCLILRSTWPLLTESAMILLQTVPTHIEVDSLRRRLTQEIPGVLAVHEFHVWQLAGDRIIASAHIRCHNLQDYMRIAGRVKEFFHDEGIHSTTIQPEFVDIDNQFLDDGNNDNCVLDCPPTQRPHCAPQTCCGSQRADQQNVIDAGDTEQAGTLLRRTNVARAERSGSGVDPKEGPPNDDLQVVKTSATTV